MSANAQPSRIAMPILQNDDGLALLDTVDQLRDLGNITHELSLPQIVVVGDQSSGKSSVLEAISGLSFPTNQGLCTQFPTEVILRRSKSVQTTVSIRTSNERNVERTRAFSDRWKDIALDQLGNIIEEAKVVMGISGSDEVSEDVLRLEICGPAQDHLTLVDLPGLYVSTQDPKSTSRDLVRKLATRYVTQPRAIVLAIVAGHSDFVTQGVLDLIHRVDKSGERTLGVVTMPDLLSEGSPRFFSFKGLIDNRKWPLRLGWHVLRNPGFEQRSQPDFDRETEETGFFARPAWGNIPSSDRGAASLRHRLSALLKRHISRELPAILADINAAISNIEDEKERLGARRDTPETQRVYLTGIGDRVKHLITSAVYGDYSDPYFAASENRLRAVIMNAHDAFAKTLTQYGHMWEVSTTQHALLSSVHPPKHFALKIIAPAFIASGQLVEKVIGMQQSHRALELPGLPQPRLVGILFKQQSERWRQIVEVHVDHIFQLTKDFVEDLLTHVAGGKTSAALLQEIFDPFFEDRGLAVGAKIDEVLRPYRNERPITLNANYSHSLWWPDPDDKKQLSMLKANYTENEVQSCQTIVQSMQAYYAIALNVLLDNVALLVVEHCLLDNLHEVISPISMSKLPEATLERLAGESPDSLSRRRMLDHMLEEYRRGQQIVKTHIQRPLRSGNDHTRPHRQPASAQLASIGPADTDDISQPGSTLEISHASGMEQSVSDLPILTTSSPTSENPTADPNSQIRASVDDAGETYATQVRPYSQPTSSGLSSENAPTGTPSTPTLRTLATPQSRTSQETKGGSPIRRPASSSPRAPSTSGTKGRSEEIWATRQEGGHLLEVGESPNTTEKLMASPEAFSGAVLKSFEETRWDHWEAFHEDDEL